ncbi:VOC family protein [Arthrobacter zhaoxinii]|uniref:VOC family protein n=1 Tax=Arthrobacter zhaoxinii TaxID=2964616 RepID=A0ABY5YQT9_9MICC|nr:VOC family protein [Arthrobacter zhaoxinii]UWX97464.1 VOC family protein [Arthrobacter zhaoxinii]
MAQQRNSRNGGLQLSATTISSPDPRALAAFYARLLEWETVASEPDWVVLQNPAGGPGLSFHIDEHYVRPVWPSAEGSQQMMMHLDIRVDDLDRSSAHAAECGALAAEYQPQKDVRVFLDPDGHPFCLFVD